MSAGHKQQNIVLQGRQGFGHGVFVAALATNPSPRACRPQSRRSIPRGFFPWFCYGKWPLSNTEKSDCVHNSHSFLESTGHSIAYYQSFHLQFHYRGFDKL